MKQPRESLQLVKDVHRSRRGKLGLKEELLLAFAPTALVRLALQR